MPSEMEKEITEEDVKSAAAEFEKKIEELGGTPEESSPEEKPTPAPAPEAVKSVTGEEEKEPEVIPYGRFKEVNQKLKELEEYRDLYEQNKSLTRRNPETGKLEVHIPEETKQPEEDVKRFEWNDEEQLAFDSVQVKAVEKLLERKIYERERQQVQMMNYQREVGQHWEDAKKEFPEVVDIKGRLYTTAQEILKTKYVQKLGNGQIYVPPHAHYTAVLEAANKLRREQEGQKKVNIEEKKTQKQQAFVQTKVSKGPEGKKKYSDKEFEKLSRDEQDTAMKEEYYALHPDEEPED